MSLLETIDATDWAGEKELWLDPLGNAATVSPCSVRVRAREVRYTWTYGGKPQEGSITVHEAGAAFQDTWHQPTAMACRAVPSARGLFQVQGAYGPEEDWGWRIGLSLRPSGELVLQMTNVTPWGEEGRAVRMICHQAQARPLE